MANEKLIKALRGYERQAQETFDVDSMRDFSDAAYALERADAEVNQLQVELDSTKAFTRELLVAEADGRLVMLPCKVGDTVYFIRKFGVTGAEIVGIAPMTGKEIIERPFSLDMLNSKFYLTRADAEKAMEGTNEQT